MHDLETLAAQNADAAQDAEIASAWASALDIVRTQVSGPTFKTWFAQTTPDRFDDGTLHVYVPNEFARDWMEGHYTDLVSAALESVMGSETGVTFRVSADAASALVVEEEPELTPLETSAVDRPRARVGDNDDGTFDKTFTFDTFVMGASNQFAYQAALAVAEAPAKAYNPLFVYGGVGLGKTHLLQAIGNYARVHFPHLRVCYVTMEQFTNDFIASIGDTRRIEGFRQRYRTNDVLLVDDIQFLAKKTETQEAFFHTFNSLHQAGRQIVLSSDRPPSEIPTLEERLRSRFTHSLPVDIQPPDLETRIAILRRKAASDQALSGVEVPDAVLAFIADRVSSNIRELHGALLRVIFYGSLSRKEIDVALAEQVLRDIFPDRSAQPVSVSTIQNEVCRFYNLPRTDMISSKRSQSIVFPRQIAMYLTRELTDLSLPRIGAEFGGRDHTTVMHATNKIQKLMGEHRDVYDQVQTLSNTIRQKS